MSVPRQLVRFFKQVNCPVGLMLGISGEADPASASELRFVPRRWQGLWEMWETSAAVSPAFSKSCGKARVHRGFPYDGSFHSPVLIHATRFDFGVGASD